MSRKEPVIELPLRVILTDTGVGFFLQNNKKLNKYPLADGSEQYGVSLDRFSAASLQHMMLAGYISRLELSRPEFVSKRSEIMDLSKLVAYGFLYKQFDETVYSMVLGSDLIKEWNRNNPGNIIDRKTKINDEFLNQVLEKNRDALANLRKEIKQPLIGMTIRDDNLIAEEKNIQVFLLDRFLDNLRPLTWFVLLKFASGIDSPDLRDRLRKVLVLYLKRSRIPEFLSLMLMELCQGAENTNMISYVDRKYGADVPYKSIVFDPVKRENLIRDMQQDKVRVYLTWRIAQAVHSIGTESRLELALYDRESRALELKEKMDETLRGQVSDTSLQDFIHSAADGSPSMALEYLKYLQDECRQVAIKFSSRVSETTGGLTYTSVSLTF